jgi:hypothetical protein
VRAPPVYIDTLRTSTLKSKKTKVKIRALMPRITEAELRILKRRYQVANDVFQSCARALREAGLSGERPTQTQLDTHAQALDDLNEARRKYCDALTKSAAEHA